MSQYDFGTIDPSTKSGTQLADDLNSWRSAVHSGHAGVSRPSYAVAGMTWVKQVSSTLWEVYLYDGDSDMLISAINPTTNIAVATHYHADGSAAAPSVTFGADTNTGIYRSGADTLDFTTGGARRGYIDSSGIWQLLNNVKVSKTSGMTFNAVTSGAGSDNYIQLQNDTRTINFGQTSAGLFHVYDVTAAAYRLVISATGMVGLGTSSPIRLLHLAASTGPEFLLDDTSQAADAKKMRIYLGGGALYVGSLNDAGSSGSNFLTITRATGNAAFSADLSAASVSGSMVASQAEMETGTATNKVVTPGRQHFHPAHPKVICSILSNMTGLFNSWNVASYTDAGAGWGYITLSSPFSSTNYSVTSGLGSQVGVENTSYKWWCVRTSASRIDIRVQDTESNANVDAEISIIACGDI